jgi:hypothetical protein
VLKLIQLSEYIWAKISWLIQLLVFMLAVRSCKLHVEHGLVAKKRGMMYAGTVELKKEKDSMRDCREITITK